MNNYGNKIKQFLEGLFAGSFVSHSWRNHVWRNIFVYQLRSCLYSQVVFWLHHIVWDQHIQWSVDFLQTCNDYFLRIMGFKHILFFSHHIISIRMFPQHNVWTIALCSLKKVLTRHSFLIPITSVYVPKLCLWFGKAAVVEGKKFIFIIWISYREYLLDTLYHINFLSPFSALFHVFFPAV